MARASARSTQHDSSALRMLPGSWPAKSRPASLEATPSAALVLVQVLCILSPACMGFWRSAVVGLACFLRWLAFFLIDVARAYTDEVWLPSRRTDTRKRQAVPQAQQRVRNSLRFDPEGWVCQARDRFLAWVVRPLEAFDAKLDERLAQMEAAKPFAQPKLAEENAQSQLVPQGYGEARKKLEKTAAVDNVKLFGQTLAHRRGQSMPNLSAAAPPENLRQGTASACEAASPASSRAQEQYHLLMVRSRKPAPTAAGTALPLSLVVLCLDKMYDDFEENERHETLRNVALVSSQFYSLARACLFAALKLALRDCADQSLRTTRLMRTLLAKRSLAEYVTSLELDTVASRPIDRSVMVSLFFDMKHLEFLGVRYDQGDNELFAAMVSRPRRAKLVTMRLSGPIDPAVCAALMTLRELTTLIIDGTTLKLNSPPVMALNQILIRRECAAASFYRLTLFSTCSLTILTIMSSDKHAPPDLSYLVNLHLLQIMQPYRVGDSADQSLDQAAHARFVEHLLISTKLLFELNGVAFVNHETMPDAPWPDLRQSSSRIFKFLPVALVALSLTAATTSIDMNDLIAFVKTASKRAPYLKSIALHKEGKGLLPAELRVEGFEALLKANGVEVKWRECRIHPHYA